MANAPAVESDPAANAKEWDNKNCGCLDRKAKARETAKKIKAILDARAPLYYTPSERRDDIEKELASALEEERETQYYRGVEVGWDLGRNNPDPAILEAERKAGREEAHLEIARKQLEIHGESVTLNGRVVTNEELYKQPTDYVKEADAEGYRRGLEEAANMIIDYCGIKHNCGLTNLAERIKMLEK
jgi:hypothetical protein